MLEATFSAHADNPGPAKASLGLAKIRTWISLFEKWAISQLITASIRISQIINSKIKDEFLFSFLIRLGFHIYGTKTVQNFTSFL